MSFSINRSGVLTRCTDPGAELVIPEGVRAVGERVFKNTEALRKIIFPASLERLRTSAFRGCGNLKEIVFSGGLQKIEGSVFCETGLERVRLPEGLTELGPNVFLDCKNLTYLELPASLEKIGSDCFCGSGLRRLDILGTPVMTPGMFYGCDSLTTVNAPLPAKLPRGMVKDAALVTFARRVLDGEALPNRDEYLSYIRKQRRNLFALAAAHEELLQVMFAEKMLANPDVEALLELAEQNASVKAALLEYQKRSCPPVDPLAEMEKEFAKAERIAAYVEKNGTLPVSELKKIWSWKKRLDGSLCVTSYKGPESVVTVPDRLGKSAVAAVENTFHTDNPRHTADITSVTLPGGLVEIGDYTFNGCGGLREITIPDSVRKIGRYVFCHTGLRRVVIPEGVQEISYSAFYACPDLKTLVLPESLTQIDGHICEKTGPVLYVPAGSYAEAYAKEYHFRFKTIHKTED